ncbi:gp44 [Streptomyces mobaraensis NBRC 13819 = DSM 40847]|uniref:DNA polymerase I n=1 Tax=Streptomyces mobaraensis (strain ATCC 29032 / DSM 40847 / JCM 4168 / NBRC 13819 / NCIMB 11159 / IPCR 16-22) TaxID=1223523 RepID=M3AB53_STRM1|nr:DNA polymerase [Streptomyces mobaraensis]EMF02409.1 gp44 [Streptomyces mobaraensis NBRC 13819 = DSM 40847]
MINVLEDSGDIPEFVEWVRRNRSALGCDTETTGLDWWADDFRLRLVQFGNHDESYVLPVELSDELLGAAVGAIRFVNKLIFQNGSYDLLVLDATTDLTMEEIWPKVLDTKILAHLVDSRGEADAGIGHSLASLTKHYIDDGVAAKIKGSMAEIARSLKTTKARVWKLVAWNHGGYLTYSGLDPILAFRLGRILIPKLPRTVYRKTDIGPGIPPMNLIEFEHKVAEICALMSRPGIALNRDYALRLEARLALEEHRWTARAQELGCENPWSTEQCADAFEARGITVFDTTPTGNRKVDKVFLADWRARGDELAEAIYQAKAARKKRNTWLRSFLESVDSNGRIHPSINSIQARTARQSIQGIPAQTLPSGDYEIRACFEANEGHIVLSTDYSNMELRFLAAHSGDKRMLRAFRNGEDLHQVTATAAGVSRKLGKMTNFLIVFGGGPEALSSQAGIPVHEAKRIMDIFMETYPGVEAFMKLKTQEARRQGYVTTPSGRRLYVEKKFAFRGTNYFVQSGSRDITCRALVRLHHAHLAQFALLPIHDEILFSVPIEHADTAAKMTDELMKETVLGLEIPTDPDRGGKSWGSLYMKGVENLTKLDDYYRDNPEQALADDRRRNPDDHAAAA